MLELSGVAKRLGGRDVVADVDLAVPLGGTTVFIGPSGSGKSTLLRLLLGLLWPDKGAVTVEGVPLRPENVLDLRRRMGYVIQDGGLFPHLTARGNVTIMADYLGTPADRIAERVEQLVSLTQFPVEGLDRFPRELSGGQRQRVSLMRALMLDPDVLLLDEPLGALDPITRSDLQSDLKRIFRDLGKTVVLVTHDLAEAGFFADRIVLLRDGRIAQQGTLADLFARPADDFVRRFVSAQRTIHGGLDGGQE